jgi:hypothetical protein
MTVTDWYEIVFPENTSLAEVMHLVSGPISKAYGVGGNEGFAVFFSEFPARRYSLYFTPKAASDCTDLIMNRGALPYAPSTGKVSSVGFLVGDPACKDWL